MYCRLLLKLILRDKAVWISTLVLAAAFSVPIAFNSPIYGPFFMKQGFAARVAGLVAPSTSIDERRKGMKGRKDGAWAMA